MKGADRLAQIIAAKRKEAEALESRKAQLRKEALQRNEYRGFRGNLFQPGRVTVIAECKAASPTAGTIAAKYDPVAQARLYEKGGAGAISVLTDREFFRGCLDDMKKVREAVRVPVLRKDFILTEAQVYESVAAGADALLLIVAALTDPELKGLHELGKGLGADVLVEVHDLPELERALDTDARIIGVNNRNLKSFTVDLGTTEALAEEVPDDIILVAESGIKTVGDAERLALCGADALLVGETLMRSSNVLHDLPALRVLKPQADPAAAE